MPKQAYRVANWSEYNQALKQRGSLRLWLTQEAKREWMVTRHQKRQGRRFKYSDRAIEALMTIKCLFHLTYRALEGMVNSLSSLSSFELPIPCYQQIQKRASRLVFPKKRSTRRPTDIVVDASGVKVYGEGEWQQERKKSKKEWVKIHIAMDPDTGEIIAEEVTDSNCHDAFILPKLIGACGQRTKHVYMDGAYDTNRCYQVLNNRGITGHVPPRQGAVLHDEPHLKTRNQAICQIACLGGDALAKALWKKLTRYGTRSHVEGAFSRFKRIFGERFFSRVRRNQKVEASIKWQILNRFSRLGRPISYAV